MPRRFMLLLAACAIGGCSRDAPMMAPPAEPLDDVFAVASAEAIEDVLVRLVPTLGEDGAALRITLLKLKAKPGDRGTRAELNAAIDRLAATLSETYRADLDAIRLDLEVGSK
jgi:hypothetical protein